jgi:hypothetical protein
MERRLEKSISCESGPVEKPSPAASRQSRQKRRAEKLPASVETHVSRFSAPARRELRRLIRTSPRFADLAETFPGAAYALASRQGSAVMRAEAADLVVQGAPLKMVARKLQLPTWLKKLPPEAFERPIGALPRSESFSRRVASRLPQNVRHAPLWLETVAFASQAADEEFAIWLAEQPIYRDRGDPQRIFSVLAAYAWFSGKPHHKASAFIIVPWRAEIAFDTALCAAKSWLNRLRLVMQLEPGSLLDSWLEGGDAAGYSFVPLMDKELLLLEAQFMQNCADQYAERLAREKCRLFSVRRNGTRIATLEIGPHARETGILTITQLKARHNMPASLEVWQAAHAWMAQQGGLKRLPPMVTPSRPFNDKTWRELIAPYRSCKNGAPWLATRMTQASFARMDMDMCDLARRAGVTSWLFT